MGSIVSAILATYIIWLIVMFVAWQRLLKSNSTISFKKVKLKYSIIIPVRNEEDTISALIDSIFKNDFPRSNYEIIVIDDHSNDNTAKVVTQFGSKLVYKKLEKQNGKKAALASGIELAKGDIIITTDADCLVPKNWLSSIARYFESGRAVFLSGGVTLHPLRNTFHRLQAIEFSSLIGVGAYSIFLKKPGMCNGANLAFNKMVFHEVSGYSDNLHLASGDDEFLMHKIAGKYPDQIFFNTQSNAHVLTKPIDRIVDFVQQRKRWASKWRHYKDWRQSVMAIFIGLVNISVVFGLSLVSQGHWYLIVPICIKAIFETLYLRSVLKFLNVSITLFYFILMQIIYPFYVVYFTVVANLAGYKWKGRSY